MAQEPILYSTHLKHLSENSSFDKQYDWLLGLLSVRFNYPEQRAVNSYFHHTNELRSVLARKPPPSSTVACIRLPSSRDKHLKKCKLAVSLDSQDSHGPSRSGMVWLLHFKAANAGQSSRLLFVGLFVFSAAMRDPNIRGEQGSAYACVIRDVLGLLLQNSTPLVRHHTPHMD